MPAVQSKEILAAAAPEDGSWYQCADTGISFDCSLTGTGAVTATIVIEGTNGAAAQPLATVTLSGTGSDADGFSNNGNWTKARARLTAISGTDAAVFVKMGGAL
jgi:hypothetical protein